ncbi:GTP-binding protein [Mycoplasmoides fastidiosum]|uniref:GTPase Obg n=1 Tax=Mycoplasmoides fastidiosum TaxID=92758 RepID=A0ABU0LYX9_9BACT|nr:GTPase ObgE [Mycoplasmoides fastidiosum]MDQ0513919.1 GTP-binding protein [Mycoplasmoides fastidiosum]UUD37667.1 GTPase ObgE [Mycoplasmoides fastidiosum]
MNYQFVDVCVLKLQAGNGGNGALAWRREAHYPQGGPFGGDGGKGGDIIIIGDQNLNNLFHLRNLKTIRAENGVNGASKIQHGAKGQDKIIKVPCGTVVTDLQTGIKICDIVQDGQSFLLCKGGKGGKGNYFFKSSINQAPSLWERGDLGAGLTVKLEIQSIADVGLFGFPNAGKSTFLSNISNAKPKIASYPFTTLEPVLGAVAHRNQKLVFADVPGLIENAANGAGLGHDFLKHLNRCKILIHLIAADDELGIVNSYQVIANEIQQYSAALAAKPTILVINKIDLNYDQAAYEQLINLTKQEVFLISTANKNNMNDLLDRVFQTHDQLMKQVEAGVYEINNTNFPTKNQQTELQISFGKSGWNVEHPEIAYWIHKIPQDTIDNKFRLKAKLAKYQLTEKLLASGAQKNDQIHAYGLVWSFLTDHDYD